jgi:crotonobetainyl-CoA:carnitine CoA-transferase CaiB-like acyl-CoA transferase
LKGIRIADFSRMLPGPYCTMILGDLGAEVIKIEPPGLGDNARYFPPFVEGESAYFMSVNLATAFSKRAIWESIMATSTI